MDRVTQHIRNQHRRRGKVRAVRLLDAILYLDLLHGIDSLLARLPVDWQVGRLERQSELLKAMLASKNVQAAIEEDMNMK